MNTIDFVTKMAQYVADVERAADVWFYTYDDSDMSAYYIEKADTARDICVMFGCCAEVWEEAKKIYDFSNSGRTGYILRDGKIVKEDIG